MKVLQFYADPGHAWLRVPLSELERLDIADQISHYSYMNGEYAYLEEDCDAGIYIKALKRVDDIPDSDFDVKHYESETTSIRGFNSYIPF